MNGPREALAVLIALVDNEKAYIVLMLVVATLLNLFLTLVVIVWGARIAVKLGWLLRANRKLTGLAETRFLKELHARPMARLLLEAPKSLAKTGPIGSDYENWDNDLRS